MVYRKKVPSNGEDASKRACALLWDESYAWGVDGLAGAEGGGAAFRSAPVGRDPRGSTFPLPDALCPRRMGIEQDRAPWEIGDRRRSGVSLRRAAVIWASAGVPGWPRKTDIGLLPIRRKPTTERVPSFSGPVRLTIAGHRIWQGIERPLFLCLVAFAVRGRGSRDPRHWPVTMKRCRMPSVPISLWPTGGSSAGRVWRSDTGFFWTRRACTVSLLSWRGASAAAAWSCRSSISIRPETQTAPSFCEISGTYLAPGWSSASPVNKAISRSRPLPDAAAGCS